MLQPTSRLTLIDAMRPPQGYRLDSAMAVTFTLDLRALLAAPAAFALTGPEGITADGSQVEPIELIHALRANAGKITIFSQVGEISLPPSRRVFAFLEQCVVPVSAPRHGVVHPKVWVLRYRANDLAQADDPHATRLRVLVASRNLTFDASWDTVVRLDQSADDRGCTLAPIGDMFTRLAEHSTGLTPQRRSSVESLAAALQSARFALPQGVDDLAVHVMGFDAPHNPLPGVADRSLVLSPFVTDDFFTLRPAPLDELVSRTESLDGLTASSLSRIASPLSFDDGSTPELDVPEELSVHDPGRPLTGLHAKVFAFETGRTAKVFIGSANATGAAFNNNVEILLELKGSIDKLGIDRLTEGDGDELGLRSLFHGYLRTAGEESEPEDGVSLDRVRHALASLAIEARVERSGEGWAVTYSSKRSVPTSDSIEIHCWPLASAGNRKLVEPGSPLDVRFETSLEAISGFLAFEVTDGDGAVTQFVVPTPLENLPEQRDRALLRSLIGNAERFLRYLLALLDDDPAHADLLDIVDSVDRGSDDVIGGGTNLPVLEKLVRTMRRDPDRLLGLHPLVTDLDDEDALPDGFSELWHAIYEVGVTSEGHG